MACENVWAPTWLSHFTATMSAILIVFTVSGNLLVCVAVLKDPYKKLRTPFMFILVNLAVTDLLVGIITLPFSVANHTLEALGTKTEIHATTSRMMYFITCTASILNLTVFCVDRFVAINSPIRYRQLLNSKVCLVICTSIWFISIGVSSLYLVAGYLNFLFIFAQVSFFLAVVISVVTFGLLRKLVVYSKERRTITNRTSKSARRNDRRVMQLFMIMLILLFLSNTPAIIFMYILKFCPRCNCTARHILRDLQFLFILSNSAVNPFVCTLRLRPFRAALLTIFGLDKKKESLLRDASASLLTHKRKSRQFSVTLTRGDKEMVLLKANNKKEIEENNEEVKEIIVTTNGHNGELHESNGVANGHTEENHGIANGYPIAPHIDDPQV